MNCPRCNSNEIRKSGFAVNKQRSFCKACKYYFTVSERKQKPLSQKRLAIELHLEGLSNRDIKKVLGVSDVAVMNWIKTYGDKIETIRDSPKRAHYTDINGVTKMIEDKCSLLLISINDKQNDIFIIR